MTNAALQQLAQRRCEPCRGGIPPMHPATVVDWLLYLPGWDQSDDYTKIRKTFRFRDFATALAFVNRLGEAAEEQDHHPDLFLAWGMVEVILWTHKIKGLSESDFIMAAKTEVLAADAPGHKVVDAGLTRGYANSDLPSKV